MPTTSEGLDVGIGMRPDLTGQGYGAPLLQAVLRFAARRYAPPGFRVTVASWNERALRLARRAGFRGVAEFASPLGVLFTVLTREGAP